MSHLTGKKITASHTTVISAAVPVVKAAVANIGVSKVVLGMITAIKTGSNTIKIIADSPGSLLAKVRGRTAIQEIRIYLTPETDIDELTDLLSNSLPD